MWFDRACICYNTCIHLDMLQIHDHPSSSSSNCASSPLFLMLQDHNEAHMQGSFRLSGKMLHIFSQVFLRIPIGITPLSLEILLQYVQHLSFGLDIPCEKIRSHIYTSQWNVSASLILDKRKKVEQEKPRNVTHEHFCNPHYIVPSYDFTVRI